MSLAHLAWMPLLVPACVERSVELTAAEREQIRPYVSTQRPRPAHTLDVSFEDKIELIGYDVEPSTWRPGAELTVTWYWKCNRALEEGWLLFTHVADASGTSRLNADGGSDIRRLYPPGRWKAGEFVRDVQRITLPADWNSERAVFFVGVWNGPHRLQITRGPNDGDNRARVLDVPVERTEPAAEAPAPVEPPPLAVLRAPRATTAPRIDGRLDDAAWTSAQPTPRFVDTLSGVEAAPTTVARVLWDDRHLYVGFEVADDHLRSTFRNRDEHLWEQDCVEVMLDPDGDGRNYFEIQISPQNVTFETRYDSRRQPQPFGHVDWNPELRSAVQRTGRANDDQPDQGYVVELAIPWTAFAVGEPPAQRPAHGTEWRFNLYVMDTRADGSQRAVSLAAPRVGDFHVPDRFARLQFVDPAAAAALPQAEAPIARENIAPPALKLPAPMIDRLREQLGLRRTTGGGLGGKLRDINSIDRPAPGEALPSAPQGPGASPGRATGMQ
ncbi:MAG: carbohydrate-binding family 9-like protein [Myxococcota bacterium]|nr:carbohydrate-binding family 9-like protein [Myxococcota bacterium]MDW8361218.1 carbohydrate-binding family 9-like protein [Myxococcales bacterium]